MMVIFGKSMLGGCSKVKKLKQKAFKPCAEIPRASPHIVSVARNSARIAVCSGEGLAWQGLCPVHPEFSFSDYRHE